MVGFTGVLAGTHRAIHWQTQSPDSLGREELQRGKLASLVGRQVPCSDARGPGAFAVSSIVGSLRTSIPLGHEQNVGQSGSRIPASQQGFIPCGSAPPPAWTSYPEANGI